MGTKQIAFEILGKDAPLLEFNLSQFSDPVDLIGAFHQVRDTVLGGRTPVVFWDEFDSQNLKWLQYLLAPMQDGKFQSGQLTHTLGKSVFVFAGATSWDFEHFGPAPEPVNAAEAAELKALSAANAAYTAARGIPHVLAVAGLWVVSGTATEAETQLVHTRLNQFLEALRREEHARWMHCLTSNGWLQSGEKDASGKPIRDNQRLLHKCLTPFDDLPDEEQFKDDAAILSLPETVALVGFKIVLFPAVEE